MRIRLLLLMLSVVFALAVALVRPLPGNADPDPSGAPEPAVPQLDEIPTIQAITELPSTAPKLLTKPAALVHHLARTIHVPPLGQRVVSYARHLLGVPYVYGGSSPRSGFDCSGLVRYVYAHFGISLAHSSFSDFVHGRRVGRWQLKPGDLVFFDDAGHVGIYIGHGRFIHAPHTGTVVRISTMSGWYSARFDGARRIA